MVKILLATTSFVMAGSVVSATTITSFLQPVSYASVKMGTATMTLPEGIVVREFRPFAYFDKHMDCIRVLTHNRSVTEHRINEWFTLYECNHCDEFDPQYVGFAIKGVKRLFAEIGIPMNCPYRLAEVIDRLVKYKSGSIMSATLNLIYVQHR